MGTLTKDTTIKGDGLKFNVRSYKMERTIDFSKLDFTASTYFAIGDLPAGFIPTGIAINELVKQDTTGGESAATLGVYLDGTYTSAASELKIVERTLGTAVGITTALPIKAVTTAASTVYTTTLSTKFGGDSACGLLAYVNNKPTTGKVKIVIAGEFMTGDWDEGIKNVEPFDPSEHVPTNKTTSTTV